MIDEYFSPTSNPFAACAAFCLHTCVCVCECVKTTCALATAESPVSLAHWHTVAGPGSSPPSTESLPSFLTGLETENIKGGSELEGRTALSRSGAGKVLTVLSAEIIEAEIATMLLSLCLFQPDVNLKRRKQPKQASEANS